MPGTPQLHQHTPALDVRDGRGLSVRRVAWLRIEAQQATQGQVELTRVNANKQCRRQWDPRLFERLQQEPGLAPSQQVIASLSGIPLLNQSRDAGWLLVLPGEAGQVMERWDPRGNHWQTEYDEQLRPLLTRETAAGQPGRVAERFTWSAVAGSNRRGRLISHDDEAGSRLIMGYSLTGAAQEETRYLLKTLDLPDWPAEIDPDSAASGALRYSPLGEVLERVDALGNLERSRFALSGQLCETSLELADGSSCPLLTDIRYNAFGQIENQTTGNGVTSHAEYDPADGRLKRLSASRPGRSILQDLLYGYDRVGNVIRIEDLSQPVRHFANQRVDPVSTFNYDSLNQLRQATGREAAGAMIGPALPDLAPDPGDTSRLLNYRQHYDYDASGNLLSLQHIGQQPYTRVMTVAENSNHAVPEPGNPLASFDANGNLHQLSASQPLQWSARNQLHSTRQVTRDNGTHDEEHYRYGGDGLRVRKVATRLVSGRVLSHEIRYLPGLELHTHAGERFAVITTQAGRCAVRCLIWSEGQPEGIANPQLRYSLDDLHDSSGLELDGQANIISHEGYYPFGGTAWWTANSAVEASYKTRRYSGKERDSTGLYYYGLRYYAAWLMRWINPDPAGHMDGLNRYRFVGNSPVTQRDDQGLMNTPKQLDRPSKAQREAFIEEHFSHEWSLAEDIGTDLAEPDGVPLPSPYELDSRYEPKRGEVNSFLNKFQPDKWTFKFNTKDTKTNYFFASDIALVQARMVAERFGFVGKRPSVIKYKSVINYETLEALTGLENGSEEMRTVFLKGTPTGKSAAHIIEELDMTALTVYLKDQDWDEDNQLLEASIMIKVEPNTDQVGTEVPLSVKEVVPPSPRPSISAKRAISRRHSF